MTHDPHRGQAGCLYEVRLSSRKFGRTKYTICSGLRTAIEGAAIRFINRLLIGVRPWRLLYVASIVFCVFCLEFIVFAFIARPVGPVGGVGVGACGGGDAKSAFDCDAGLHVDVLICWLCMRQFL